MSRPFALAVLLAALTFAAIAGPRPAAAQEPLVMPTPNGSDAEVIARAAIEQLVRALGLALQSVPQYDLPRVNPRGDIIIRRLNPPVRGQRDVDPDEAAT
jgi:hypothetical protein